MVKTKHLIAIPILIVLSTFMFGEVKSKTIVADYTFYFGGFSILQAETTIELRRKSYKVVSKSKTDGLLNVFFEWSGQATSQGNFLESRLVPSLHQNVGKRAGNVRKTVLLYESNGEIVSSDIQPPPDLSEVFPIPRGLLSETIDPLTAIVQINRRLERGMGCNATFPVFDGRRRYDLTLADRGELTLKQTPFSVFQGKALVCEINANMLGGHKREKSKYTTSSGEKLVYVGRPLDGGPILPVGLTVETAFGTLTGHLVSIKKSNTFLTSRFTN